MNTSGSNTTSTTIFRWLYLDLLNLVSLCFTIFEAASWFHHPRTWQFSEWLTVFYRSPINWIFEIWQFFMDGNKWQFKLHVQVNTTYVVELPSQPVPNLARCSVVFIEDDYHPISQFRAVLINPIKCSAFLNSTSGLIKKSS